METRGLRLQEHTFREEAGLARLFLRYADKTQPKSEYPFGPRGDMIVEQKMEEEARWNIKHTSCKTKN